MASQGLGPSLRNSGIAACSLRCLGIWVGFEVRRLYEHARDDRHFY